MAHDPAPTPADEVERGSRPDPRETPTLRFRSRDFH